MLGTSDVAWNATVKDPNLVKDSERLHYMLSTGDGERLEAWTHPTMEFDGRIHNGNLALPLHR